MEQSQYFDALVDFFSKGIDIMRAKNADYAHETDPFRNFRAAESLGITLEQGILVRMSDKMSRIGNLLQKENNVKDESIEDTLQDLANYAAILATYIKNKNVQN